MAFFWVFPPFQFRSRAQVELARAGAQFNATEFVRTFWNENLDQSFDQAADASVVLIAIATSPDNAREKYGRTVGISSTYCLYLRGTGRVVEVSSDQIGFVVNGTGDAPDIVVPLGLVFGNAVRDGTGLLDPNVFPNAQQFNDIAAGLNGIVETTVLPELQRIATKGARIDFVGCVELDEGADKPLPLRLVPVWVQRAE